MVHAPVRTPSRSPRGSDLLHHPQHHPLTTKRARTEQKWHAVGPMQRKEARTGGSQGGLRPGGRGVGRDNEKELRMDFGDSRASAQTIDHTCAYYAQVHSHELHARYCPSSCSAPASVPMLNTDLYPFSTRRRDDWQRPPAQKLQAHCSDHHVIPPQVIEHHVI